jgi:hypothetical protein
LLIVLLTSRPIDRYPNIYTDTVDWLNRNGLVFDYIWWGEQKAHRVIEGEVRPFVQLAVDDDPKYIAQYSMASINSYWLRRDPNPSGEQPPSSSVHEVKNLQQVVDHYDELMKVQEADLWNTQTPNTVPTLSTPEKNLPLESTKDLKR